MEESLDYYIKREIPNEIEELIKQLKSKRALIVVNHIKEHGYVTNEDLLDVYGYGHGPRAVKDAKDRGIPIKTLSIKSPKTGRTIAAYVFDDITKIRNGILEGRKPLEKRIKEELAEIHGEKCYICTEPYETRYLQADHKIPYDVVGENSSYEYELDKYMLLCRSCNRAKSWSCEYCENFLNSKDENICKSCYWASPDSYNHIAMKNEKRLELVFSDNEIAIHEIFAYQAKRNNMSIPELIKEILKRSVE